MLRIILSRKPIISSVGLPITPRSPLELRQHHLIGYLGPKAGHKEGIMYRQGDYSTCWNGLHRQPLNAAPVQAGDKLAQRG